MKKRGISRLVLISLAILIVGIVAFLYFYTGEEKTETVPEQKIVKPEQKTLELTPEELEKAKAIGLTEEEAKTSKSLEITPEEFKEVSTKAEEAFTRGTPFEGFEKSELIISYSKLEDLEKYKGHPGIKDTEIKPGSKIIRAEFVPMNPSPYLIYLIENGEVNMLTEKFILDEYY